jgi:PAS domain S-box-containing protein
MVTIPVLKGQVTHYLANMTPLHDVAGNITGVQVASIDITERVRLERQNANLTEVLRAIRNVNQLITREHNRGRLVQQACELIVETRGFNLAWILLVDREMHPSTIAGAGDRKMLSAFKKEVKAGRLPACISTVLKGAEHLTVYHNPQEHGDCPLARLYEVSGALVARLEHRGKVFGVLGVSVPQEAPRNQEEVSLFDEVAGDIAYALRGLENEDAERTRAEALRQSAELYRSLLESLGSVVVRVNREGKHTFVGGNTIELNSRSVEEYTAGRFGDDNIPEDREKVQELLEETFRTGKPIRNLVTRHKRGDQVRHVSSNWEPIRDAQGNVVEVQTTSTDITELVEAQEKLRQSEEFFRGIVESGHVGITTLDLDGRRTYVSPLGSRLSGRPRGQELGEKFGDNMLPESHVMAWKAFHRVVETGEPFEGLMSQHLGKGGQLKTILSTLTPVRDAAGRVTGVQNTFVDITPLALAQEKLRQSEEFFRGIVESGHVGVNMLDRNGRRTFVSMLSIRLFGRTLEEETAGQYGDNMLPESREVARKAFRRVVETGAPFEGLMTQHRGKGGQLQTLLSTLTPVRDAAGRVTGVQSTFVDVTPLALAQEKLRESEAMLRQMMATTGMALSRYDLNGRRTFANDAWLKRLGRTAEDSAKGALGDQLPPEEREKEWARFRACIETGKPSHDFMFHLRRGGAIMHIKSDMVPILDTDGKITGVQITSMDVTSLMEAQEKLRQSEELYRSLLDAVGATVLRVNREGRRMVVAGNPVATQGRTAEDYQRGIFGDAMVPEDREKAWALLRETFETGKPVRGLVTRQMAGDEVLHIMANWEPIKDSSGNVVSVQTTSFDITSQVEAERQRQAAQRLEAMGAMAGGIAHDVNNILAMVVLWTDLAQAKSTDPQVKEDLANVTKAAMDGAETMRRLRRFSSPTVPGVRAPVNLNEIASDAILFTRPMWKDESEAKDIGITVKEELAEVPMVEGNAPELREAMVNLLTNAVEAMPRGGILTVRTCIEGESVCVSVSDTGVGIPDHVRERLFEPYFTTRGREGSGLGLSAVKSIVTSHGGSVRVESEVGKGTTFTISLPVTKKAPTTRQLADQPEEKAVKRCHVLAVDDEPLVRRALEAMLREAGHTVVAAGDGQEAIAEFERRAFDVVLLDLGMPDMNGYQVAERMKAVKPEVPIILVTGWGEDMDKERVRASGIAMTLGKPFKPDDLARALRSVVK